jgi:hypothetical protein
MMNRGRRFGSVNTSSKKKWRINSNAIQQHNFDGPMIGNAPIMFYPEQAPWRCLLLCAGVLVFKGFFVFFAFCCAQVLADVLDGKL